MFNTTSSSLSVEGRNIEILKSFPLSSKDVFLPKIMFQLHLSIPIIFLLNSTLAVALCFNLPTTVLGFVMS